MIAKRETLPPSEPRYTPHQNEWHRLAQTLGLRPAFPPNPQWSEFDGRGILAIHHAKASDDHAGRTDLHLLSDDLDGVEARLTGAGCRVGRTVLDDIGPMLTATATSGAKVTISGGARAADSGELAVQPIWYQPDLAEPRRILETIGLRPRIASAAGTWLDFATDGGGWRPCTWRTPCGSNSAWSTPVILTPWPNASRGPASPLP